MKQQRVFISAVSTEFSLARVSLAHYLRSAGFHVEVQETLVQRGGALRLLSALRDFIRECDAVICLIGAISGSFPTEAEARECPNVLPDGINDASYTQWEWFLAVHYRKYTYTYVAPDVAAVPPADDCQARFLAYVRREGVHRTDIEPDGALSSQVLAALLRDLQTGAGDEALANPNIADPGRCIGRDSEIDNLVTALVSPTGSNTALVFGGPGFGKTTLTEKVAVHLDIKNRFGPRRWLIKLETVQASAGIIEAIAVAIGLDQTAGKDGILMRLGAKPALLVLDNLETPLYADPPGTRALLKELRAEPALALIASLRSDEPLSAIPWDASVKLDTLSRETSRALFLDIAKEINEDDPDLDYLLNKAGDIPLAIYLIATCVGSQRTLSELQRAWERSGPAAFIEPGGRGTREGDLEACIEFSLSLPVVEEPGRRLFCLLGQLPGGIGTDDQPVLLGADASFAPRQLRLVGLLRDRDSRLDLLPPIREVAMMHAPSDDEAQRWIGHYLAVARDQGDLVGKDHGRLAAIKLTEEIPNIGAAMLRAATDDRGRAEAIAVLAGLLPALRYTGANAGKMLEKLAELCGGAKDWRGQAVCLVAQAEMARVHSDNDRASAGFRSAQERLRRAPDRLLEAHCLWGLAEIARAQDRYDDARGFYDQARGFYLQASELTGEAYCLRGLAEIARSQDLRDEARALYERARERYVRMGALTGEAHCLWGLAAIAAVQDRYDEARSLYEQAQEGYGRSGAMTGEAYCIRGLADLARSQDRYDEARGLYEQAREWYVRAGRLSGEANCVWSLAEIARLQDRDDEARGLYQQARELYARAGGLTGEAQCLWGLADIARVQGSHDDARSLYEEARGRYVRAGGSTGEADCLRGLAEIALVLDHHHEAGRLYEEARERYVRAGGTTGEADCLKGMAEVARAQGRHGEARYLYEHARSRYRRAGRLTGEAACLRGFAEIARRENRYGEAQALYEQALELFVRAGRLTDKAHCVWGLAAIAGARADHDKARDLYKQARDIYVRTGGLTGEANCLRGLAMIASAEGHPNEAQSLLEQARAVYARAGGTVGEAQCLADLAEIAETMEDHDAACRLYRAAEELFRDTPWEDWLRWVQRKRHALEYPEVPHDDGGPVQRL